MKPTDQTDSPQSWTPFLKLIHPVGQGGFGNQDHVGAVHVTVVFQVSKFSRLESKKERVIVFVFISMKTKNKIS